MQLCISSVCNSVATRYYQNPSYQDRRYQDPDLSGPLGAETMQSPPSGRGRISTFDHFDRNSVDRQTDRQTDRRVGKLAYRLIDRQTDRQTELGSAVGRWSVK